jgi:DnaJ-class molecular chaperone
MLTTRCPTCHGSSRVLSYRTDTWREGATYDPCQECGATGRVEPYEQEPSYVCSACNGSGESYSGLARCYCCNGSGEVLALPDEFTVGSVEEYHQQLADEAEEATP